MSHDDDPTHALDDFVRRLRPAAADSAMPDLSGLGMRLHPPQPSADQPAQRGAGRAPGGRSRHGQSWQADDVEDVVDLSLTAARQAAAPRRPDADVLQLQRPATSRDVRWLTQWQPGAWIGAVRWVIAARTELVNSAQGPVVDSHPPQALLLLWPPQTPDAPARDRWPTRLWLGDGSPAAAAACLLASLDDSADAPAPTGSARRADMPPAPACLWLDPQAEHTVDWALAAEALLLHHNQLLPHQLAGLRQFIDEERARCFARLNQLYSTTAGGAVQRR